MGNERQQTRLTSHSEFDGYTIWPHWLKLERQSSSFTGYSSTNGTDWVFIGRAELPGATSPLDAGMFAFRTSARFADFKIQR